MFLRRKKVYKHCQVCEKIFIPEPNKEDTQFCCKRKCYMTYYRKKIKEEEKFPSFICPKCEKVTELSFDPKKSIENWQEFKCSCGFMNNIEE